MISKEKVARFYNKDVYQYNLKNTAGMQVSVLNYGGIITKILFYDKNGIKEIDEHVDFIIEVCKAINMKMLITVPTFDIKDKTIPEIKEEAVARLRYLSDKVGEDMKISLEIGRAHV